MLNDLIEHKDFIMVTYVLGLEDECFYIGRSSNLNQRLAQHVSKNGGSVWCKEHDVKSLLEVHVGDVELEKTIEYFNKYGFEKVRGASWCRVYYPPNFKYPKTLDEYYANR